MYKRLLAITCLTLTLQLSWVSVAASQGEVKKPRPKTSTSQQKTGVTPPPKPESPASSKARNNETPLAGSSKSVRINATLGSGVFKAGSEQYNIRTFRNEFVGVQSPTTDVVWAMTPFEAFGQKPPSSGPTRRVSQQREEWQTSWIRFVQEVSDFCQQRKDENQQVPETTFQMTLHGQRVPKTWGIMKRFGSAVEFEGTFKGVKLPSEKEKFMEGQTMKLDLVMPTGFPQAPKKYGGTLLHAYPKPSTVEAWKKVAIGAHVRFRATVTGVAVFAMPIRGGLFQYHVLLEEAEPLH